MMATAEGAGGSAPSGWKWGWLARPQCQIWQKKMAPLSLTACGGGGRVGGQEEGVLPPAGCQEPPWTSAPAHLDNRLPGLHLLGPVDARRARVAVPSLGDHGAFGDHQAAHNGTLRVVGGSYLLGDRAQRAAARERRVDDAVGEPPGPKAEGPEEPGGFLSSPAGKRGGWARSGPRCQQKKHAWCDLGG